MKTTKKYKNLNLFLIIGLILLSLIFSSIFVYSQSSYETIPKSTNITTSKIEINLFSIVSCQVCRVYHFIFYFAGAIASIIILAAGIKWIGSGDDDSARGSAKNSIIHAIIGLVIVLIGTFIVKGVIDGVSAAQMIDPSTFIDGCFSECNF